MRVSVETGCGTVVAHLSGRAPGSAPGILLLHANPGDHRDFAAILPALDAEWAVAALDWPGFGASTVTDPSAVTASALPAVAARVLEVLQDEHGFGPVTVIGNSLGGYAALRLAQRASHRVRGAVLVQPAGFVPHGPVVRAMARFMSAEGVAKRAVRPAARLYLGPPGRGGVDDVLERAGQVAADPVRLAVYRALWRSIADPDLDLTARAPLSVPVPVRVVWGKRDPINPWPLNRRGVTAALPTAGIAVLPTRHEPFCEAPRLFLDTVLPFLRTIDEVRR